MRFESEEERKEYIRETRTGILRGGAGALLMLVGVMGICSGMFGWINLDAVWLKTDAFAGIPILFLLMIAAIAGFYMLVPLGPT